jgi:hypothetical protein
LRARTTVDVTGRFRQIRRDEPLDFVLRLGRVALDAAGEFDTQYGVWCFEHENDGPALPFARDVYDGDGVARAALLRYAGGTVDVLQEGYFPARLTSYSVAERTIADAIATWPARACRRITTDRARTEPAAPPRAAVGFTRLHAALVARRLALMWRRLFRHPQWNIGAARASILDGYRDDRVEWFPLSGRKGFLADPFAVERGDGIALLCEYFPYREGRGRICGLTYAGSGFSPATTPALTRRFHLSYPCLVDAGGLYCVPETSAANEVALYDAESWSKVAVLLDGFPAVDPTVFHHGDRWWMMCTRAGPLEDTELWVWHAPELLGPWTSHADNPVKTDIRGARPAGLPVEIEGALYRPTQDCSRRYGWRIAIHRVTRLTPAEFAEEPVAVLEAARGSPYPDGRHTLAVAGEYVFVDGLRTVFIGAAFRAFLGIFARDLARRLGLNR